MMSLVQAQQGEPKRKPPNRVVFRFGLSSFEPDAAASNITGIAELARLMTAMFPAFAEQNSDCVRKGNSSKYARMRAYLC